MIYRPSRRRFLINASAVASATLAAPAISYANSRPKITHGLQSGAVGTDRGIVWARADHPSQMIVEVATRESFKDAATIKGPNALDSGDFTAQLDLRGLPPGETIFYRIRFDDLAAPTIKDEPVSGRFKTAPATRQNISFVWTGDTAGQGWGINKDWGGMRGDAAMLKENPDFFVHSGDTIYADGPLTAEKKMPSGKIWKNVMIEEKAKVAETLKEFRGNFKYNLMDDNVRAFNAAVPMFAQWDGHDTVNNWYPGEMLVSDDRYKVKSASLLAARANRAFREMMPIREHPLEQGRIYRKTSYGPLLDVFFLDLRTYRGPNGANNQEKASAETAFLGAQQLSWLKRELLNSKATWKVIASDMPIGLIVYDNWRAKNTFENGANGDGPIRGREHDFAGLLRFIKHNSIRSTA